MKKSRGGNATEISLIKDPINLILIWGCRPAKGVLADTKMCADLRQLFNDRFDRQTLKLEIPKVFDQLKATDAQFEMVTSNTLQQLSLVCQKNKVTQAHGVVFVNTKCKDLTFEDAESKGDLALDILVEELQLDDHQIYRD